jgi:DNA-binding NarL/FixJ family response regulator
MSRTTSTTSLLLLDEDSTMIDALSSTLRSSIPRLSIDACFTSDEARQRLRACRYHAIVCSPALTVAGGNSILTSSRRLDPPVPFLLTVRPDEFEFASQWLDLGVYDFVFSPLQASQVRESVADAVLLSKWRLLIARKQQALAYLRLRRDRYQSNTPETFLRHRVDGLLSQSVRIQESTAALQQTSARIEVSLQRLRRACNDHELHAQQRALHQLKTKLSDKCGDLFR